jgi:hypothetical protein
VSSNKIAIMTEKEFFVENLYRASGGHGMSKEILYKNLQSLNDCSSFIQSIKKAFEHNEKKWLSSTELFNEDFEESWTIWHHIDEPYSEEWGFNKKQSGCYIYGLFETSPSLEVADYTCENVFYIGESRSITRNGMINRGKDFKGTVKNDVHCPHGCGTAFIKQFGRNKINKVYQAYLPLPAYLCKEREMDLLVEYFRKNNRLPFCNHQSYYNRVSKLANSRTIESFYND